MMSPYPFGSLFSDLGGYGGELDTCPSVILCLAQLCNGAKLEIGARMDLIC